MPGADWHACSFEREHRLTSWGVVAGVAMEGRSNNRVQRGGGRGEGVCLGFFPFWPKNAQTFFSACLTLGLPQVRRVRS